MLEESTLPIDKIRLLASARSAGKTLKFKDQDITIEETTETAFEGVDIALFSAGGSTSAKYAPYAVKAGAVVVDNTSIIEIFRKFRKRLFMGYTVAVVGATGAVGAQMIKMLEESTLPIDKIRYLASARSAGKTLKFKDQNITIEETTETAFEGVDIALFSAGGSTSAKYAPYAVKAGSVVVDNTSYFRQNPDVPLVVPEVNAHALDAHNGIIACPNCSTIQMMVALEPVRQKMGLGPYHCFNLPSSFRCWYGSNS